MQQLQQRYKSERHTSCGRAPHLCARCRQSATSRQVSADRSADTWRDVDTERSADALLTRGGDTCRCLRHVSAGRQQSALTPPRGVSRALCCHLALCARRSTGALCCRSVAGLLQVCCSKWRRAPLVPHFSVVRESVSIWHGKSERCVAQLMDYLIYYTQSNTDAQEHHRRLAGCSQETTPPDAAPGCENARFRKDQVSGGGCRDY